METDLIAKFLRHLISCTETVLEKKEIESFDIASLRRELSQLQRSIDGKEKVNPVLLGRILDLKLDVEDSLLDDSKRSIGISVAGWLLHGVLGSTVASADRIHRLEIVKQDISRFRDDLDHLRFALEP